MADDPKFETTFGTDSETQGYTLFNRLIHRLNGVVQSTPEDVQNAPGTETDGTHYIVGSSPSGDWSTFSEHDIAIYFDSASSTGWIKVTPEEGWLALNRSTDRWLYFDGTQWVDFALVSNTALRFYTTSGERLNVEDFGLRIVDDTGGRAELRIESAETETATGESGFFTYLGLVDAAGTTTAPTLNSNLPTGGSGGDNEWVRCFNGTTKGWLAFWT